jgi:hypothetical protein
LRIGSYLLNGGRFTGDDPWAPTADERYTPTQWLPEVLGAWLHSWAGLAAIADLRLLGLLTLMTALLWLTRAEADRLPAILAAAGAFIACGGSLAERPQLLSFVFLAITVRAWLDTSRDGNARWWLVPLTWLWANCHGLWVFGLLVGGVILGGSLAAEWRTWRAQLPQAGVLMASLTVVMLTPLGPRLIGTPFQVAGAVGDFVQEWQPATIRNGFFTICMLLVAFVITVWARRGERAPLPRLLLLLMSMACLLWMGRLVAVAAILSAPLVAEALQSLRNAHAVRPTRLEIRTWVVGVLVASAVGIAANTVLSTQPAHVPHGLDADLAALKPGSTVLVEHGQSGWLMWRHPQLRVVVDLRSEIYSERDIRGYVTAMNAEPGWREYVASTGAQEALLPSQGALALALRERASWTAVASSGGYTLLSAP